MTENLLTLFNRIFGMLPRRRKRQYWLLVLLMLLVGVLETITLGIIALFAAGLNDPGKLLESRWARIALDRFPSVDLDPSNVIFYVGGALIAAVILKNALTIVVSYGTLMFGTSADGFYGERLLKGFLRLPYEWHQNRNSADLIIAVNWRFYLGTSFLGTTLQWLCDVLVLAFLLATLFVMEPLISTYIFLGFGTAAMALFLWIKRRIDQKAHERKEYEEAANREATKTIHGMKDVRIFLRESHFLGEYSGNVYRMGRGLGGLLFYQKLPTAILETLGIVSVVLVACGMLMFLDASVERVTGMLAMLVACAWRALPALNRLLSGATQLKSSAPYVRNFLGYLEEAERSALDEGMEPLPGDRFEFKDGVEWEDVSFRYASAHANALNGVSMAVRKGETLGIVGPSGAGKSTLVDVLIGLNAPSGGRISVDGVVLEAKDHRRWRKLIGYVPQTPYIYDGSLAENIAFGIPAGHIDRERVLECCRMASIDFLEDLEKGIDAPIGERGAKLSGGQRQRIAIARALYHQPSILIFDEATSALDSKNERAIQKTVYALKGTLTIILIAHRLTTVTECDRVICLKGGQVVMEGAPEKVLPWYEENLTVGQAAVPAGSFK